MRVGVSEARNRWSVLLRRVPGGETVHITRRGVLIAKLVSADAREQVNLKKVVREIRELRKSTALGEITIREWIEEGRRY